MISKPSDINLRTSRTRYSQVANWKGFILTGLEFYQSYIRDPFFSLVSRLVPFYSFGNEAANTLTMLGLYLTPVIRSNIFKFKSSSSYKSKFYASVVIFVCVFLAIDYTSSLGKNGHSLNIERDEWLSEWFTDREDFVYMHKDDIEELKRMDTIKRFKYTEEKKDRYATGYSLVSGFLYIGLGIYLLNPFRRVNASLVLMRVYYFVPPIIVCILAAINLGLRS